MACVMLATCWMVTYGYIMEAFMAWYSGEPFEKAHDVGPRLRRVRLGLLAA